MSLADDRTELATILSGVAGLKGHRYRPTSLNAGDSWPLVESLDNAIAGAFQVTWRVVVILPSDERAASDWFDQRWEMVADALLDEFGVVDRIQPAAVDTEAGAVSALLFTVRKEA